MKKVSHQKNPGEASSAESLPIKPEIYELGKWGGFTQWRCLFCAWDTLEGEAAMLEHYETVHKLSEVFPRSGSILLADRDGKEKTWPELP